MMSYHGNLIGPCICDGSHDYGGLLGAYYILQIFTNLAGFSSKYSNYSLKI